MTPDDIEASLTIARRELVAAEYIDSANRRTSELAYWSGELKRLQNEWLDKTVLPMPGSRIIFRHSLNDVKLRSAYPERLNWDRDVIAWRFEP